MKHYLSAKALYEMPTFSRHNPELKKSCTESASAVIQMLAVHEVTAKQKIVRLCFGACIRRYLLIFKFIITCIKNTKKTCFLNTIGVFIGHNYKHKLNMRSYTCRFQIIII